MEINMGPFILSQRTPYSKCHVFLRSTGANITSEMPTLVEDILYDYNRQKEDPEKYFEINNNKLINFNEDFSSPVQYVFIPEGVKYVESLAFSNRNMRQVYIPDTVKVLREFAFQGCSFLNGIYMPDSIEKTGIGVFQNCINLMDVRLSESLREIEFQTFEGCIELKDIVIPKRIQAIGAQAFARCFKLENVSLSEGLEILSAGAFEKCKSLEKIDLPNSLKSINSECFLECISLKEIALPDGIVWLPNGLFSGCIDLRSVKLPKNSTGLRYGMFKNCKNLRHLNLPDTIANIDESAFENNFKLRNINIPRDLQYVGELVFASTKINSLTINHNLESIEIDESMLYDVEDDKVSNCNLGLIHGSDINKLIINETVQKISPSVFGSSGGQITKIDYLGSKEKFEAFKSHNYELFDSCLINVTEINFIEKENDKKLYIENISR